MDQNILRDKIYACWLGKNIGGTLGAPIEGRTDFMDICLSRNMFGEDKVCSLMSNRETLSSDFSLCLQVFFKNNGIFRKERCGGKDCVRIPRRRRNM